MQTFKSDLSQKRFPVSEKISAKSVRQSILELIQRNRPDFGEEHFLALSELNPYREKYIAERLSQQIGELTELERMVLESMNDRSFLTEKLDSEAEELTLGQKLADRVADFGGSWTFITLFGLFLLIWISLNLLVFANRGFDPYPFILLNLILSCIAALQAPIIMMSQNRQEEKDRERAKKDYMINLKSELEIRLLHEKIDHLIIHQQQELMEIQKVQIEMMADILRLSSPQGR
jgi:uncharacterized membrane protein